MNLPHSSNARCGLDTVEIARIERLLKETPADGLKRFFTSRELEDAGNGQGRPASLAARFAAKEACCKLFPRETALGIIEPSDFGIRRDAYGAPEVETNSKAREVLDRHHIAGVRVSLTHTDGSASAIAWADPKETEPPWYGKLVYYCLPLRRGVVMANLRRVFGAVLAEAEMRRVAQAYYAHFIRFFIEMARLPFMSPESRKRWIRVENMESPIRAHDQGKGLLLVTGHFGN